MKERIKIVTEYEIEYQNEDGRNQAIERAIGMQNLGGGYDVGYFKAMKVDVPKLVEK